MKKPSAFLAAAAILVAFVLIVADYYLAAKKQRLVSVKPGERLALSGVGFDGRLLRPLSSQSRRGCRLVRFVSKTCPYCSQDIREHRALEQQMIAMGCGSVVLAPEPDEFPEDIEAPPERVGVALTAFEFGAASAFRGTPTTMLLDAGSKVLWSKLGPLSSSDVDAARVTLESGSSK